MNSEALPRRRPRLLNVGEVADYLGLSPTTVYRLVEARRIPFHRVSRSLRFSPAALDAWVAAGAGAPH